MHRWSLYLDTSVFGGFYDEAFLTDTRRLWDEIRKGGVEICISSLVERELRSAPAPVRNLLNEFAEERERGAIVYRFDVTEEMVGLASAYVETDVVSKRYSDDALHVAAATVFGADYVVSWNYAHLVNVRREAGFNGVNLLKGYPEIRIVTPSEVITYGEG